MKLHCVLKLTGLWFFLILFLSTYLLVKKIRSTHVSRIVPTFQVDVTAGEVCTTAARYLNFRDRHCSFDKPILTLFTTAGENRDDIHSLTVKNWAVLGPCVQAILFIDAEQLEQKRNKSSLAFLAESHGWAIWTFNRTRDGGLPVLKDLFTTVIRRANSTFIGYANADILFDVNLLYTLSELNTYHPDLDRTPALISGIRTNGKVIPLERVANLHCPSVVASVAPDYELCRENSADYFITSRKGLLWKDVPDFIPARPGYDSWFLGAAVDWQIFHVDVTATVTALHQASRIRPDYMRRVVDKDFNIRLVGEERLDEMCTNRRVCRHACARFATGMKYGCSGWDCYVVNKRTPPEDCIRVD